MFPDQRSLSRGLLLLLAMLPCLLRAPGRPAFAASRGGACHRRAHAGLAEPAVSAVNLAVIAAAKLPEPGSCNELFAAHKVNTLERTLRHDKSPKGEVDRRVVEILQEINRHNEYVTTSSCSGRALFMAYGSGSQGSDAELVLPDIRTKVGRWRRVTHDEIERPAEYFDLQAEELQEGRENLWFALQPFSLDVACASAAAAQKLVAVASQVYQRGTSIISPKREWKTVVNIEGHERLEMPLTLGGQRVYCGSPEALAAVVNGKFRKNWGKMAQLLEVLRAQL